MGIGKAETDTGYKTHETRFYREENPTVVSFGAFCSAIMLWRGIKTAI